MNIISNRQGAIQYGSLLAVHRTDKDEVSTILLSFSYTSLEQ